MVLNLEQLSNENLVNFYKEELKMIGLGEPASFLYLEHEEKATQKRHTHNDSIVSIGVLAGQENNHQQ